MLIDNLSLFLLIIEKGSLTAAARESGLSPTTVSERLATLESHYGTVLLNRTTRSLSLTEAGRTLVEGARQVLDEVEDLEGRIRYGAQHLTGPIRFSAPSDLGRNLVATAVSDFIARHPGIRIELMLSDGYVDFVGQGLDLALRFGQITDSSLRLRALPPVRRIVCASPDYLKRHPTPVQPDDLADHNCLLMRFGETLDNVWPIGSAQKLPPQTVKGDRISNDGAVVRQWAIDGHGLAYKAQIDVLDDLASGRLTEVLQDYTAQPTPLQIMFPPGRAQPVRIRHFADFLANRIQRHMGADQP
ncbi:MAG: LysR family transcriptional regulator [Alphaproteobacteria bacterium]